MAFKLLDRMKVSVSGSPGTGNITIGGALTGYQTPSQAGANDGDSFPYEAKDGNNWEYGVATFIFSSNSLSRVVGKTSAQNTSPLSLSSSTTVTATVRAEDIQAASSLAGLSDVNITNPGVPQAGQVVAWEGSDFELHQPTFAELPDKPTIPVNNSFTFAGLSDVNASGTAFTNGYAVTWNNATNKYILAPVGGGGGGGGATTLAQLTDVNVTEGPGISTFQLTWNDVDGFWEPYDVASVIFGSFLFSNLLDGSLAPGPGTDGWAITWNDGAGLYELASVGGGGSALTIKNNGTNVETATTSINIINATSITTTSGAVTLTLPTGGGGGITYTPPVWSSLATVTNLNSAAHVQNSANIPSLFVTPASGSDGNLYCAMAAVPSGHFSMVTKCRSMMINTDPGWKGNGICVHNSVNGNNLYFFRSPARAGTPYFFVVEWTAGFTSSSTVAGNTPIESEDFFLHIDWDGTSLTFGLSFDAVNQNIVYTDTSTAFLGGAPTHCGIGWSGAFNTTTGPYHTWFHYFAGTHGANGL